MYALPWADASAGCGESGQETGPQRHPVCAQEVRWQNPSETSGQHGQHPAARTGPEASRVHPLRPPLQSSCWGFIPTRAGTRGRKQGDFLQQTGGRGKMISWIINKRVSLFAHFPVIVLNTVERRRSSFRVKFHVGFPQRKCHFGDVACTMVSSSRF